jgi:hypothetical protein
MVVVVVGMDATKRWVVDEYGKRWWTPAKKRWNGWTGRETCGRNRSEERKDGLEGSRAVL